MEGNLTDAKVVSLSDVVTTASLNRDTLSSAGSVSSSDSRPSSQKKSLRSMIKGGLLKGKNATILKQGAIVQDGVKIAAFEAKAVRVSDDEHKMSRAKHKIMEMMQDEDLHDMVSARSHLHEFSLMRRTYEDYAYKNL